MRPVTHFIEQITNRVTGQRHAAYERLGWVWPSPSTEKNLLVHMDFREQMATIATQIYNEIIIDSGP
jgi:hypothetical protein